MSAIKPAENGNRQRDVRVVVENRQARHLYSIEDTFEAGIMLMGWEVKAILAGQASFNGGGSFVRIKNGEAFLDDLTITPLANAGAGSMDDREPIRIRKLLLNKSELKKLQRRVVVSGYTVVPLALTYGRMLKVNIGLAKGKNDIDKRNTVKDRENLRSTEREFKVRLT